MELLANWFSVVVLGQFNWALKNGCGSTKMTKCVGWYLNFEPSLATRKVHQTYQRSSFLLTDVILGELTDVTVVEYYG